jgi:hypothetical protein
MKFEGDHGAMGGNTAEYTKPTLYAMLMEFVDFCRSNVRQSQISLVLGTVTVFGSRRRELRGKGSVTV